MIVTKETFGAISIAITLIQYVPLIYLTAIGKTKPHAVSRLIWALMMGITFAAQYADRGGAGSWANGASALCCLLIAGAALRHGKTYITRPDLVILAAALLAIPAWRVTHNPFYAALWTTVIDLIGYVPTFRKAWHKPHEEMISAFSLGWLKQFLGVVALENYSLTTLIYPVSLLIIDFVLIALLFLRRLAPQNTPVT